MKGVTMTDDNNLAQREREITTRWDGSQNQVADTARAVATGQLDLANTAAEIRKRRARLAPHNISLESIIGTDDSLWSPFLSRGVAAAGPIGRIVDLSRGEPPQPLASGVLIGASLLLTNNHVLRTPEQALDLGVQFGYEYDDDGGERKPDLYQFAPQTAFYTQKNLDFTIVGIAGNPPGATNGTVTLIADTGKVLKAENLNVIHHPDGDRKKISIRENRLVAEDARWLRYLGDTAHGSSGSGVFNDQWEMVALHHGGVPRTDTAGHRLTRTGAIWTEDLGEQAIDYIANEGARVSRIVRALRAARLNPPTAAAVAAALPKGATP
jgi:V8-like Glu-specific endopeptidase